MWKPAKWALALLLAVPVAAMAVDEDQWLHVAVDDDDERVRINVPLTVVQAILPLIETHELDRGRLRLDELDMDLDHADLVKIIKELEGAKDGQYVTVEDGREKVQVSKESEFFHVHVTEESRWEDEDPETVEIKVPVKVLAALTSGDDDELDLLAAIEALAEYEGADLVTVNDDGASVRIWIDRKPSDS